MKKTLISVALAGMTLMPALATYNDDIAVPYAPSISHVSSVSERAEYIATRTLSRLKSRGAQLIRERVRSLESNSTAINQSKLTVEQKATLVGILNTNITGLTALGTSLATSTDATSTKALVSSIYTNFRIYGVLIPQVRLEKRIYELQNHATRLSDVFIKTQTKINEYKGKGKDVTVWQKSLDDAKVLVAVDLNKLTLLMDKTKALKPSDYGTTSKATIDAVNLGIKEVGRDYNSIHKTLRKPYTLKNATTTPAPVVVSSLASTTWVWMSVTSNGTTTLAPAGDKFVLTFDANNRMSSATDCNSLMGSYAAGTSTLSFGPLAMTMMFCEGSKEAVYAGFLGKTILYTKSDTTLTLTHDTGVMVFRKK